MTQLPENGMIHLRSQRSVELTIQQLEGILASRGLTIFARVDHSAEAAKVGLKMPEAVLIIFGNPKSGTPVMIASPKAALDLPLKALVWNDAEGNTWLSYNSAEYLQQRHNIPDETLPNIAGAKALLEAAVR